MVSRFSSILPYDLPSEGMLVNKLPYKGTTSVIIGDGSKLPISCVGQVHLKTYANPLVLKNLLYLSKHLYNLLSVKQLCTDNNCSINFDVSSVHIKDKDIE